MAQLSYPSPSHNARNITEAEYEKVASRFSDDGVDGTPLDVPVISAGVGLEVVLRAGVFASVRGFAWTSGTVDVPLTISGNASGSTRYDAVVLRLDRATWDVRAAVRAGTPGSGAPTLAQDVGDTGQYEILLAYVTVPPSAASVTVSDRPQYIGSRIRPADNGKAPPNQRLGEIQYRPNTGQWRGWNGTEWNTIHGDSGDLAISPGYNTWQQVYSNVGRKVGAHVWLRVWVRRVTLTFGRNDSDGSKIGVLPAELQPRYIEFFAAKFSGSGGSAHVEVRPDGELWVTENDSDVTVGRHLAITMNYLI